MKAADHDGAQLLITAGFTSSIHHQSQHQQQHQQQPEQQHRSSFSFAYCL
jgi:hypothetical protein